MQTSLVTNKNFELAITIIILLQAATLALETFKELESFKNIFEYMHLFVLAAFTVEAGLKIATFRPKGSTSKTAGTSLTLQSWQCL